MHSQETDPTLRSMLKGWLDQEDQFDNKQQDRILQSLSDQDQKIVQALKNRDLNLLRKVFVFLAKKKKVTFLKTQLQLAKKTKDPILIKATIRLLAFLHTGAKNEILQFLKMDDSDILESCCEALRISPSPSCHEELLRQAHTGRAGVRRIAWRAFKTMDPRNQHSLLFQLKEDLHPDNRLLCAMSFCNADYRPGFEKEILEVLIGDEDERVLQAAWKGIEKFAAAGVNWAIELQQKVRSSSIMQELEKNTRSLYEKETPLHVLEEKLQNPEEIKNSLPFEIAYSNGSTAKKTRLLEPLLEADCERTRANTVEALAILGQNLPYDKLFNDSSNRVKANAILAHAQNATQEDRETRLECLEGLRQGGKNQLLSYLFCLKYLDDEGLAAIAFEYLSHSVAEVSNRAYDTLDYWAGKSEGIRLRLAEHKRNKSIFDDDEEPLDEFLE